MNFVPKMNSKLLVAGYEKIVNTIYSPKQYYDRIKTFLSEYRPRPKSPWKFRTEHLGALIQSVWILGIKEKGRGYFWKLMTWTVFRKPRLFPLSYNLCNLWFPFPQNRPRSGYRLVAGFPHNRANLTLDQHAIIAYTKFSFQRLPH